MDSNDLTPPTKPNRPKRQRSPSGSSSSDGDFEGSTTSCSVVYESTEEEEDMANCLILLAQGDARKLKNMDEKLEIKLSNSRKFYQVSSTTTSTNKAGFYVYECKTCNRSFPSFQALGGHRASHKKPKSDDKKSDDDHNHDDDDDHHHHHDHQISLQISTINKGKIHECSICGSEFTSGQALGGHMRRHRAANNSNSNNNQVVISGSNDDQIKPRSVLYLDLNLPAPEDDHHLHRESKFQFASTQQALVFSPAPALIDCHY